jgi:hypothetical protein
MTHEALRVNISSFTLLSAAAIEQKMLDTSPLYFYSGANSPLAVAIHSCALVDIRAFDLYAVVEIQEAIHGVLPLLPLP